uniref:Uncharacterized protein n=1 Tax=Magallana gigas TaxID=29159 RepID=K1RFS4_MAGGI
MSAIRSTSALILYPQSLQAVATAVQTPAVGKRVEGPVGKAPPPQAVGKLAEGPTGRPGDYHGSQEGLANATADPPNDNQEDRGSPTEGDWPLSPLWLTCRGTLRYPSNAGRRPVKSLR